MLVLTRQAGQSIIIGDNIEIVVTRIDQGHHLPRVILGIVAPKEVNIRRGELVPLEKQE